MKDSQGRLASRGTATAPAAAAAPAAGPAAPQRSVDEVAAELKRSPLFMTELEENDDTEALRALAYEGTPLEVGADFKASGNECFRVRRWADAREFYGKGILVLSAEERRREREGRQDRARLRDGDGDRDGARERERERDQDRKQDQDRNGPAAEEKEKEEEDAAADEEATAARQREVLESLYVNRAACQLELGNHRSCWLDCAAALRLNAGNVKAWYRSARALLAVGRLDEAEAACARALALHAPDDSDDDRHRDRDNEKAGPLPALARDIARARHDAAARRARDADREARRLRRARRLAAALRARGIRTRTTTATAAGAVARPPGLEDARVRLVPDPDDEDEDGGGGGGGGDGDDASRELSFPLLLLYPADLQSDVVKAVGERDCLADHLAYILPPPWDGRGEYGVGDDGDVGAVECYMETVGGGLIKVGKRLPLLDVLSTGKVELVDDLVRVFCLPKAKAAAWAAEHRRRAAVVKGGTA